jgi:3-oxoacyl-[acyl-carrier-protein] synthase-3
MGLFLPVVIRGTGSFVPSEVLTNEFFAGYLDTSDEWIVPRTGIRERRRVAPDESTLTLAKAAAERALADAGMTASDLDLIVVATVTPDTPLPATACWLQAELGVTDVPAYDLAAACSGFVYGLVFSAAQITAGLYKNVLLVAAETLTRITDYEDRATAILFGDAAGAAVVSRSDDPGRGILYQSLGAKGQDAKAVWIPAGGSREPASARTVAERLHYMKMRGSDLFKFAVGKMEELVVACLEETGTKVEDLAMVIPHQSNLRIMEAARRRIQLPIEKLAVNIDRYGNTSAASIPLALDEARRKGRLRAGDLVMFLGFGGGLTWGVTLMRL